MPDSERVFVRTGIIKCVAVCPKEPRVMDFFVDEVAGVAGAADERHPSPARGEESNNDVESVNSDAESPSVARMAAAGRRRRRRASTSSDED